MPLLNISRNQLPRELTPRCLIIPPRCQSVHNLVKFAPSVSLRTHYGCLRNVLRCCAQRRLILKLMSRALAYFSIPQMLLHTQEEDDVIQCISGDV